MNAAYVQHGLTAHAGKAVRRATSGVAWGLQLDGVGGWCSTPPSRTLVLASLTVRMASEGFAT
eukprot:4812000-Lingulodinium_polyedra.AAC.1